MNPQERHLIWFLRLTGVMFLCAAPAVVMPSAWMRAIAAWLGLDLPDLPLVEYLTRSVSALYTVLGAAYWFMSCDVRRYLPLLRFTVPCTVVFDVTVIALDLWIPMPLAWTAGEGASILAWTAALWWLVRRVDAS
ncbi:MAG: hypothetical protein EXR98_12065 [Gemmataceae bacterium]|nr:hypothetical protein [Gemmataceae bacterium]